MLATLKKLFVSRTAILVIFLLLVTVICLSLLIPQQQEGVAPAGWFRGYPVLARAITTTGLDHVYGTWWFLALALVFCVSLVISTWDQGKIAWRRTVSEGRLRHAEEFALAGTTEPFASQLRGLGYRPLGTVPGGLRLVKSPWGYWGNFLLHLGLAFLVVSALIYVATEHRVIMRVIEGEEIYSTGANLAERRGVLAAELPVPAAIRMDRLQPEFYDDGQLLSLASSGTFRGADGVATPYRVAINDKFGYRGLIVYQKSTFGRAFQLRLAMGPGTRGAQEILYLPHPVRKGKSGYGTLELAEGEYTLKGKYGTANPDLTLRLLRGPALLGEVTLAAGETGQVGPCTVTLEKTGWWTEYLFEGSHGTMGIFTGFAFILLGVMLTYFAVPCVVTIIPAGTGSLVTWQSQRFNEFFRAERDRVVSLAGTEGEQ